MPIRFVNNYLERHQNRTNQLLHLIGVPLSFVVSVISLVQHEWLWAAGAFAGGYVLRFIGHGFEGNDAGEVILIKKMLRKPYIEFGPEAKHSKIDD